LAIAHWFYSIYSQQEESEITEDLEGEKLKIELINQLIKEVQAENIIIPEVFIESGALQQIPPYLRKKEISKIVLVVDDNTKIAAGAQLEKLLDTEGYHMNTVILTPNIHGQVIANEQTLIQLFVEMPNETDIILAVGSGTIHDIVRFVGYKMNVPFISVPTAASVDGFTSKGAPLIFKGFKETVQTVSPLAVFADIAVLKDAPREMTAAGFGDIVGKYTSLLDWKISSLVANEPYSNLAADLTRQSLESCVNDVHKIAENEDEGLEILMQSLIESGLVMLILDFSRPASGSEHHLSHYWEMDLLKKDAEQLLHGAKVGVASTIMIDLYKQFCVDFDISSVSSDYIHIGNFMENWQLIKNMIDELPNAAHIRSLLKEVGGPTTSKELNIENQLVANSLNEAFHLRDRCTGLLLINLLREESIKFPISE
jgi:glycerol-1-phosphate dehydrogenase [NAD(P)+]